MSRITESSRAEALLGETIYKLEPPIYRTQNAYVDMTQRLNVVKPSCEMLFKVPVAPEGNC
jgi:hypothetical protein